MSSTDPPLRVTRRRLLAGAGALVAAGALDSHAAAADAGRAAPPPAVSPGRQPPGLPARQHAWEATLASDRHGNPVAPRFDRLLFFDVRGRATAAHARLLEAGLRTLERAFPWGPEGLLFTAGWGNAYFSRVLGVASPIQRAHGLSQFELPSIDDYHLCLHLACDDEQRLAAVEAALVDGVPLPGADGWLALSDALVWRETRTGFVGAGLPAAHQRVGGIPPHGPVARSAPMFMGFQSSLRRNQASEDSITIRSGPFAQGTTMAVSYIRLRLDGWYERLDERGRVARMYSPQTTPADLARITTDAPSQPGQIEEAGSRYGVIGHAQSTARARRHGRPLILRRDFDTVDGGHAGVHFVSLQRTLDDFVTTRNAMNAVAEQQQHARIADTFNNGINDFISVLRRANYILPSRAARSFPLLLAG